MTGSIRLLLASLLAAQLSGVISTRIGGQSEKDRQLRRNAMVENRNGKEEGKRIDRIGSAFSKARRDQADKMQRDLTEESVNGILTWQDDQGYGRSMYDDIFEPKEEVAYAGNAAEDDYFKESSRGWDMSWNNDAADGQSHYVVESHDEHIVHGRGGKSGKAEYYSKGNYAQVKGRKGDYYYKGGKSGKLSKRAYYGHSNYYTSKGYYQYEHDAVQRQNPPDHDDYVGYDDYFYFTDNSGRSSGYGEVFHYQNTHSGQTDMGNNYYTEAEGPTARSYHAANSQNVASNEDHTRNGNLYYDDDDDFFHRDPVVAFLPRPTVVVAGNVFSQNPNAMMPPVVPDLSGDSRQLGTEYLFSEVMTDSNNIISQFIPISVDNENVNFNVALDGYCTRIGPPDQNSVQGYCFFTYTFLDPRTGQISGSFTAQGIIVSASVPGQLTVSGGTGIMTGAVGLVEILPAALDEAVSPPLLVQPAPGADPFNDVAGWAHFFEITVDILFFLPELYAPPSTPTNNQRPNNGGGGGDGYYYRS